MSTDLRLHIDPADVLGISREATIQQIRDAYRSKVKLYHPDTGGEEWAFRILVQAYEVMSTARIAFRATEEQSRPATPRRPAPSYSTGATTRPAESPRAHGRPRSESHETVRPGVQEPALDPAQVVDVEKVAIRYEADHVWLITDRAREDRYLSCCLNITWPDPESAIPLNAIAKPDGILKGLDEAFEALSIQTRPISARSSRDGGRFTGWLSYPNDERAQAAFIKLRHELHQVGLVVKQWSRDLVIPRQWR